MFQLPNRTHALELLLVLFQDGPGVLEEELKLLHLDDQLLLGLKLEDSLTDYVFQLRKGSGIPFHQLSEFEVLEHGLALAQEVLDLLRVPEMVPLGKLV